MSISSRWRPRQEQEQEQCHSRGPLSACVHCAVDRRRSGTHIIIVIVVVIRLDYGPSDGRVTIVVLGARHCRHWQTAGRPRRVRLPGRRARDHHSVRTDAVRTGHRGPDEQTVRRRRRENRVVRAWLLQSRGDTVGYEHLEARGRRRRPLGRQSGRRWPSRFVRRAAPRRLFSTARDPATPTRLPVDGSPAATAATAVEPSSAGRPTPTHRHRRPFGGTDPTAVSILIISYHDTTHVGKIIIIIIQHEKDKLELVQLRTSSR